jgi:hypothetical protein
MTEGQGRHGPRRREAGRGHAAGVPLGPGPLSPTFKTLRLAASGLLSPTHPAGLPTSAVAPAPSIPGSLLGGRARRRPGGSPRPSRPSTGGWVSRPPSNPACGDAERRERCANAVTRALRWSAGPSEPCCRGRLSFGRRAVSPQSPVRGLPVPIRRDGGPFVNRREARRNGCSPTSNRCARLHRDARAWAPSHAPGPRRAEKNAASLKECAQSRPPRA